jgi:hypothetical protein
MGVSVEGRDVLVGGGSVAVGSTVAFDPQLPSKKTAITRTHNPTDRIPFECILCSILNNGILSHGHRLDKSAGLVDENIKPCEAPG